MSTHRHSLSGYRNTRVPLFQVCCGLLLALQLWLVSSFVAFASAPHTMAVSITPAPTSPPTAPSDQGFALARVSVVRLLVSYNGPGGNPIANCTGLGVVVKSLPDNGGINDGVLTDGSLVNKTQAMCAQGHPAATLSQILIYVNRTYYKGKELFQLDSNAITCSADAANCSNGPALLSFQGDEFPSVDLAPSSEKASGGHAIALVDGSAKFPPANSNALIAPNFLTPQLLDPADPTLEPGTPLIDASGHLTGLHLSTSTTPAALNAISTLLKSVSALSSNTENPVDQNWKAGITAFYQQKNYAAAQTDFQQAATANANFQGASDFVTLAQNAQKSNPPPVQGHTSSGQPSGGIITFPFLNLPLDLWELGVLVLVVLAVVFLIVSLIIRPRVQRHRAVKAEIDDADRRAELMAQQIKVMEAAQRDWVEHNRVSEQPTIPVQPHGLQDKTVRKAISGLHCPSCGELVAPDANYCPNCRQLLSPSESGLHLRVQPLSSSVPAQSSVTSNPFANANSRSIPPPPPPPMSTGSSLADQPTIPPLPVPMSPADPVAEHPTVQIGPNVTRKMADPMYDDITIPFSQQVQRKYLGFIVGTNSNPGIKRKYKPNEDSLLAAQGLISSKLVPQPFGLFVIADGMGGHANGQDASRLAIQMIVENIVPKLVTDRTGSIDYAGVLVDAIQSANNAVHQQNMEKRGDMGTTVTSALVVGPIAYVANVGDSRTYLYRDAEGLKKVTNDHSVVASLVEAGIIKPDDIYTHPKRNQIYRSLGEKANVEVDVFTVPLHEGDKLMLCSDGLWDMVRDPQIEQVIKQPVPDPSMTSDALIQSALEGGGEDNVSVVVVQITEGGNPEALPRVKLLAKPDSVQMPQF